MYKKMYTDSIFFRDFKPCMGKKEVPVMISRYSPFDKECRRNLTTHGDSYLLNRVDHIFYDILLNINCGQCR